MQLREYVITVRDYGDLDSLYDDLETVGGNLYIPERAVEVYKRRPVSRNTHYLLSKEEAEQISKDPRVISVELSMQELGVKIRPLWTQSSSNWDKSSTVTSNMRNWGLLRVMQGANSTNWGVGGTTSSSGEVILKSSGKNVDVLIIDGHIDPNHPEFAKNSDGTGGTRVKQFDWFSLAPRVLGNSLGTTYQYSPYIDSRCPDFNSDGISDLQSDNDHGMHVAGIAAGNTYGWARDADIYNISPYQSNSGFLNTQFDLNTVFDFIREWHKTKPVNPLTGVRNPTVCNQSYGGYLTSSILGVSAVRYNGVSYTKSGSGLGMFGTVFTTSLLKSWGLIVQSNIVYIPWSNGLTSFGNVAPGGFSADMIDAMKEGIIFVGSAGNDSDQIFAYNSDVTNGYNNQVTLSNGIVLPYNRGSVGAIGDSICVGAASALVNESKAEFSNCGNRVDIFAPGQNILSSVAFEPNSFSCIQDPRNSNYKIAKYQGTSMASPCVTGVIACLLESQPRMTQLEVRDYLINTLGKSSQMTATTGGYNDLTDLQGAPNRYLSFKNSSPLTGNITSKFNSGNRPIYGQMWPRQRTLVNRM